MEPPPQIIVRLIGVYDANGSVAGELAYLLRRTFRGEHCELCSITHGALREKKEWRALRSTLPVPFEAIHLDERSPEFVALTDGATPCVVADFGDEFEIVLGRGDLAACSGSPAHMVEAVIETATDRGWAFAADDAARSS